MTMSTQQKKRVTSFLFRQGPVVGYIACVATLILILVIAHGIHTITG